MIFFRIIHIFENFLLKKSGKIMKMYGLKFDLGKISLPLLRHSEAKTFFRSIILNISHLWMKVTNSENVMNSNATLTFENIS